MLLSIIEDTASISIREVSYNSSHASSEFTALKFAINMPSIDEVVQHGQAPKSGRGDDPPNDVVRRTPFPIARLSLTNCVWSALREQSEWRETHETQSLLTRPRTALSEDPRVAIFECLQSSKELEGLKPTVDRISPAVSAHHEPTTTL